MSPRVCPRCGNRKTRGAKVCRDCNLVDRHEAKTARKLPLAPLLALVPVDTVSDFARELGVTRKRVHRYMHDGIPDDVADGWAVHFRLHPAEVWGDQWWAGSWEDEDAA